MRLHDERERVVAYCQRMDQQHLTVGTSGNISIYNPKEFLVAISPTGVDYSMMKAQDVVVVTLEGKKVEGELQPSSEVDMHCLFYQHRPDVLAVVHTHSLYATALACLNQHLPMIHPILACAGGEVQCLPFLPSHTKSFAQAVLEAIESRYALLLGNHGVLAAGTSIEYAYQVAEMVEFCAQLYCISSSVGKPILMSEYDLEDMNQRFSRKRTLDLVRWE